MDVIVKVMDFVVKLVDFIPEADGGGAVHRFL